MQFLTKIKAHYEKIVLGAVLLGVAAMALFLTKAAGDERDNLAQQLKTRVGGKQNAVKPVDLAGSISALERLSQPAAVQLAGEHKTFNPNTWIYKSDGTITHLRGHVVVELFNAYVDRPTRIESLRALAEYATVVADATPYPTLDTIIVHRDLYRDQGQHTDPPGRRQLLEVDVSFSYGSPCRPGHDGRAFAGIPDAGYTPGEADFARYYCCRTDA